MTKTESDHGGQQLFWNGYWHWASLALTALAILWPVGMLLLAWGRWELSETLLIWKGDAITESLPRLKAVDKENLGLLRYLWYTIAAEPASTRWWTSVVAVVGGILIFIGNGLCHPRYEGKLTWFSWMAVGVGLIAIGLDERFQVHEWVRVVVLEPSAIGGDNGIINPGDFFTLIYPIGAIVVWRILHRSLVKDPLARFVLIVAICFGMLAVGIDILAIDALDRYPGWAYGGIVEEFAEWETTVLLALVGLRRLILQVQCCSLS